MPSTFLPQRVEEENYLPPASLSTSHQHSSSLAPSTSIVAKLTFTGPHSSSRQGHGRERWCASMWMQVPPSYTGTRFKSAQGHLFPPSQRPASPLCLHPVAQTLFFVPSGTAPKAGLLCGPSLPPSYLF